jgi:hypothetical protein
MTEPWMIVLATVVALVALRLLLVFIMAGGDVARIKTAIRASLRILRNKDFANQIEPLLAPPAAAQAPKLSGVPLRMLALLQREGRLVDFLLEDIDAYGNDQVGAAVRDIHRQCQHALQEHLVLEPVLPCAEGDTVEVPAGFDPSAIQLTGNVTGQPPFRGALRHHGWRAKAIKLAPLPEGQDDLVLHPAEVELP